VTTDPEVPMSSPSTPGCSLDRPGTSDEARALRAELTRSSARPSRRRSTAGRCSAWPTAWRHSS